MANKQIRKLLLLGMVSFLMVLSSCKTTKNDELEVNYRDEMRQFVIKLSEDAKELNPNFIIISQNGHSLLTINGESNGRLALDYLRAIDGVGREDLFYGYEEDNRKTNNEDNEDMLAFMEIAKANDITVLVTDYCFTHEYMDDSYLQNSELGYLSFAADERMLNDIPTYPVTPYNVNDNDILTLSDAKNFLYLINPELFSTKEEFINAILLTNYDLIIIDLFFIDNYQLTSDDIKLLKTKENGGSRLVIAYMSIGEAEDYRYYWLEEWDNNHPSWLDKENAQWEGNYKVKYWDKAWQNIIFGNNDSYLKMILDASFDGVYLDIIDAYEYFEEK